MVVVGDIRASFLLALVVILGHFFAHAIPRAEFYDYNGIGSYNLEVSSDGQIKSTLVKLRTSISFFDSTYDTIYVNGNGVLSFLAPMERFINIPFPLDYPIISPLYTHVDIRASGVIYVWETDTPGVISKAVDTIHEVFTDSQDFHPSNVFIVTWDNVGYYSAKNDKVNTYQVAISSNGSHSYVEFLYPENGIQWIQAESHPSGLPDAKAQAGVVGRDGRKYTLKGSGTDQIQNLDKWSNVNNPGRWVFRVGPLSESENIQLPNNVRDAPLNNEIPSCLSGATSCHSKADCIDYSTGFCCACKTGFFGNGKSCQSNVVPIRVIGKVSGVVNGQEFQQKDLQCYVQTKDGRTYTAMSRVPEFIGAKSQLLQNLGSTIGWLFAKPIRETKNGYQLTGGVFNLTADIIFANTWDNITIHSTYLGLDVFGQLRMSTEIKGSLPELEDDARIEYVDHEELYTKIQPGTILSQSIRSYRVVGESGGEYPFNQSLVITYKNCEYAPDDENDHTVRLKFSRDLTTYEAREQIIRFAMNTKVGTLEEEDPCILGKSHCGDHSSCIVEGDDYKCVCNPGYQYLYERDSTANCVDVNECTSGTHACSPDALCINNEGSHICQCLDGFFGDGRTCEKSPTCDDTDCGIYADCNMVDGRPACSCAWGFEYTDQGCYPIKQLNCEDKVCSPYAHCTEDSSRSSSDCVCDVGFVGDGYNCEPESNLLTTTQSSQSEEPPIPECFTDQCWCAEGWEFQGIGCVRVYSENSTVVGEDEPTDTSTTDYDGIGELSARPLPECLKENDVCICPWGYVFDRSRGICLAQPGSNHETMGPSGTQFSCNVMNHCHPYAQCVFVPEGSGVYLCKCNAGYEGDGIECTKIGVTCLEENICDRNASCQPIDSSRAECVCDSGFEGDGITCTPIDECREHADCGEKEQCQYNQITSRYTCTCMTGHNRVDEYCIADCSTDPAKCHVNARCVSKPEGGHTCVCINGYSGDGFRECLLDHVGCNVINSCGRNAICGYNPVAVHYACQCKPGYYGDGFTCLPESSCKRDPRLCSVDATCVRAGENQFACICNAGFTGDGTDCTIIPQYDSNILLINQEKAILRIPFFPTLDNPGSPISLTFSQMAIALDIDCAQGRAYWSDINGNKISSMTYNGSDSKVFVTDVASSEGIAIDWISRNAFWTDAENATVQVANLDTQKRKVLISDRLTNPRGIAAHPYRGKIFWSDWNRAAPKLEWANEDGTQRAIFLQNQNVQLPNSLAIDWSTDELCWADAGVLSINCANIDTRVIRIIASELAYPFGLAISQNHYYWTDWKTQQIEIASKNSGERNKPLEVPPGGTGKLYGIVAVPEFCPRISNVCQYDFGGCNANQLCLPDGQGGRTCACADNISEPCTDEYQTR